MPIVEESIELDVFAGKSATTADDWNDVLLLNEYKDMSNIDIKWNQVPADGLDEKRNLALASGDLPDAFYAANISIADLRSEEHTSELQSRGHLVCRLLLEKKKISIRNTRTSRCIY